MAQLVILAGPLLFRVLVVVGLPRLGGLPLGMLGGRRGYLRGVNCTFHMYSVFFRSLFLCFFRSRQRLSLGKSIFQNLELLHGFLTELPILSQERRVDGANVVLERGVAREVTLAEDTFEGLQLHVDALRMVLQVRNRLESFATARVSATERPNSVGVN